MATIRLGIDMGSSTTTIYRLNSGLVLREPSKVLCEKNSKGILVREVGTKASKLQGTTPDFMTVISPIVEGLVKDANCASKMLKTFVQKVTEDNPNAKVNALINVPCGANLEERRKISIVGYNAGITQLNIIPNVIACALGAGCDIQSSQSQFIVDIGGGCTDIAVVGLCSIIHGMTLNVGSNQMDIAIQDYIEKRYGVHININTAQMLKEEIGSLLERDTASMQVNGVDLNTNELKMINVTAGIVCEAVAEFYEIIADSIRSIISMCSKEIVANLHNVGIIICGKAGQIVGLDKFMQERVGLFVTIVDGNTTANGLGMLLGDKILLNAVLKEN